MPATPPRLLVFAGSTRQNSFNRRLAAALALLSIVIQFGLIIASWVPMMEWPVAIWSGIALMHLISQGARDGAGTLR